MLKIYFRHFLIFFCTFAVLNYFLNMKKRLLSVLALFCAITYSVSAQNTISKAVIGFYNVENLFDTINDPNKNDEQFLPNGDYQWRAQRRSYPYQGDQP